MKIRNPHNDAAVLAELGQRLAHRRVEAGFTQEELSHEAGVSKRTVERLEAGSSVQLTSLVRVLRALALLGSLDALLPQAIPGPMELLQRGKRRQRVRRKKVAEPAKPPARQAWHWNDES